MNYDYLECDSIYELEKALKLDKNFEGYIFCFGTSFISQLIMAKTRKNKNEKVPSHVALIKDKYIYESTTEKPEVGKKRIPSGVRRWQLRDYIKYEKGKETRYAICKANINIKEAEYYVHYPYGRDTILDYVLADGSDGVSYGLICSQYANLCTKEIDAPCVTPAELFRAAKGRVNRNVL